MDNQVLVPDRPELQQALADCQSPIAVTLERQYGPDWRDEIVKELYYQALKANAAPKEFCNQFTLGDVVQGEVFADPKTRQAASLILLEYAGDKPAQKNHNTGDTGKAPVINIQITQAEHDRLQLEIEAEAVETIAADHKQVGEGDSHAKAQEEDDTGQAQEGQGCTRLWSPE